MYDGGERLRRVQSDIIHTLEIPCATAVLNRWMRFEIPCAAAAINRWMRFEIPCAAAVINRWMRLEIPCPTVVLNRWMRLEIPCVFQEQPGARARRDSEMWQILIPVPQSRKIVGVCVMGEAGTTRGIGGTPVSGFCRCVFPFLQPRLKLGLFPFRCGRRGLLHLHLRLGLLMYFLTHSRQSSPVFKTMRPGCRNKFRSLPSRRGGFLALPFFFTGVEPEIRRLQASRVSAGAEAERSTGDLTSSLFSSDREEKDELSFAADYVRGLC